MRPGHQAVGQTVEELDLPPRCLVASIRRSGRTLIPRGHTRLEAGDIVAILVPEDGEQTVRTKLIRRQDHRRDSPSGDEHR